MLGLNLSRALCLVLGTAICGLVSAQGARIGFGRFIGMGGAGLALPRDGGQLVFNPAILARSRSSFALVNPYFDYYADGLSIGELQDEIGTINGGGLDSDNLGEFAQKFGDGRKEFGLGGNLGAQVGGFYFGYSAEALVNTIPNAELRAWSRDSGNPADFVNPLYDESFLDGYGFGYTSFDVGYGLPFQSDAGTWNIGTRVRMIKAYFTHHTADAAAISSGGSGTAAPEMNGEDVIDRTSTGMDLGVIFTPAAGGGKVHYGFVVESLVQPDVGFRRTLPGGSTVRRTVNPFETAFSAGIAFTPDGKVTFAADLVDIGDRAGRSAFRAGAMFNVGGGFELGTGFDSEEGWSAGLSAFGFTLSFQKDQPLWLGRSIRF